MFGGSVLIEITEQFGLLIGGSYYLGGAPVSMAGSYSGGVAPAYLEDMRIDLSGLELSIGAELLR